MRTIAVALACVILTSNGSAQEVELFGEDTEIRKLVEFKGHEGEVNDAIEIYDGRLLTAGSDGTIRLWDTKTGGQGKVIAHEKEPVTMLQLLGNQLQFLSFSPSGTISVWQLPQPKRSWGPEQATGSPDSGSGDQGTAWASATEDKAIEWLVLEYAEAAKPVELQLYENYNPGAVVKVTGFDNPEKEITLWEAAEKSKPAEKNFGVLSLPLKADAATKRIKLYIDSPKVKGWNEIDAVGLVDDKGKLHWAVRAGASSTYADRARGTEVQLVQ
jgi:hypothetical protein